MVLVTITSDFGSLYPAAMKGVIYSINNEATIVDITHSIPPSDIKAGAFALYSMVPCFPPGTIHVAVVDPGVGTGRRALVIKAEDYYFVGPDNGILIPAATRLENMEVYEINTEFMDNDISSTFHGRDIFAPAAAYISKGSHPKDFCNFTDDYVHLDFSGYVINDEYLRAQILFVDEFGNIVTNIPGDELLRKVTPDSVLSVAGRQMSFLKTYGDVLRGDLLSLIGSHSFLEISVNQGNASKLLHLNNGHEITISILRVKKH